MLASNDLTFIIALDSSKSKSQMAAIGRPAEVPGVFALTGRGDSGMVWGRRRWMAQRLAGA
jgi:hypothetical protein